MLTVAMDRNRTRASSLGIAACVALSAGALLPALPAHAQGAQTPSGTVTFFASDRGAVGETVLGRGTIAFQGKDYPFQVTGMSLANTAANTPRALTGQIFGLSAIADANGNYVTVGRPTARSYVLQNAKGVRVELSPVVGTARLPSHDAANPVTITLQGG